MKLHLSPKESIKAQCLACTGGHGKDVEACDADQPGFHQCPFHPYRLQKKRPTVKILRQFCLQCMGGSLVFVRECQTDDCFFHPYRLGKNPARKGSGQNAEGMAMVRAQKRVLSLKNTVDFKRSNVG